MRAVVNLAVVGTSLRIDGLVAPNKDAWEVIEIDNGDSRRNHRVRNAYKRFLEFFEKCVFRSMQILTPQSRNFAPELWLRDASFNLVFYRICVPLVFIVVMLLIIFH